MAKRVQPGDVLAVPTSGEGRIYLHYLGKHPEYGDGVAVCRQTHTAPIEINAELFRSAYVTFFPATAAVTQGLASIVGHLLSPGVPKRMRRAGVRSGRKVDTWIIEDGSGNEVLRRELSEEERKLPIVAIWTLDGLITRVSEGWFPEMEY